VSKSWANFNFWVNYSLKGLYVESKNQSDTGGR